MKFKSLIAAIAVGFGLIPALLADLPATITRRDNIKNAESVFENTHAGTVAFLGGSITEGKGYSTAVMKYLKAKYPQCAFTEINAGISSTCSDTGAFRVQEDILSKRKVDLFFVEFAVNDDQDGHFTEEHARRGMEGIVRQVRKANPACDIVMIHFVNPGELKTIQAGGTPIPYAAHESVAARYGVPTVNIGAELARLIAAGTWTWEKYGVDGNGHPTTEGGQMAADKICELLTAEWTGGVLANPVNHTMPEKLDPMCYSEGGHIPLENAVRGDGWNLSLPNWASIEGNKRDRYTADPILWSETPGSEFTLTFTGTAVGAFVTSFSKDVGALDVSVDGGDFVTRRMISTWSYSLHYPMTVMLADDLAYGEHTLRVKLVEDHKDAYGVERLLPGNPGDRSNGKVARIHALCVNGVVPEPPPPASNVKFVKLADNLKTAVESAAAGDELRLEKGTFTVGSTITSSKALKISGGWTDITTQDPESVTKLDGGATPTSATVEGLLKFTAGTGTINLSKLVFTRSWASGFKKTGDAWLVVTDCQFRDNGYYTTTSTSGYQGLGAYVSGSSSSTEVSFTRCVFSNNVTRAAAPYYNMQGAGLYASGLKSLTLDQTDFLFNGMPHSFARNGTVTGRESMHGFALYADSAPTTATGCRFIGNCGAAHSANSGSVVYLKNGSGGSSFKNCLWTGNLGACFAGGNWSSVSGALVVSLNSNDAAVSVENCTMAFNAIEGKEASAGLTVDKGAVTLRSSIVWGNRATWEGNNGNNSAQCVAVHANGSLDADYSIFEADDSGEGKKYVRSSGKLVLGRYMKYVDPLFAAPNDFMTSYLYYKDTSNKRRYYFRDTVDFSLLDLHVKSPYGRYTGVEWVAVDGVKSPAIDAGDPNAEYANEPPSNGERVNMGFYGNTAEASKSESVEPTEPTPNSWTTLASITKTSWTAGEDDPGVVTPPVAQYNDNLKAVTISKDGAAATAWDNVMPTEAGQYTITWTVLATTEYTGLEGASVSFTISAPESPVDPTPVVTGTFVSLTKSLADAISEASDGDELHLQTGTFNVSSTISTAKALTISGGWTNATTQDPEAVTTLDGGATPTSGTSEGLLKFTAGSGTTELSKLVFTRSWASGLKKSDNANLVVTDCQFLDNGYYTTTGNSGYQGLGAHVSGSSSSTEVSFTRCVFSNNVTRITTPYQNMQGAGLYVQNLKSLTLEQTDFLFNGMPHSLARKGTVTGREGMHGFAFYANSAPTAATGCRFVGNCGAAHSANSGSVVYLTGGSGGSSFRNCLWTGNLGACFAGGNWSNVSGALVVSLNSNTAAVSVENCTMAFNAIEGKEASAGLTVDKGAVTLRSSIIWGNYATRETANGNISAQCVAVHANGSLNADYSIFEASDGIYVRSSGTLTLGTNMKYVDPQFAAPSTFMDSYLYFRNGPTSNKRQFYFRDTVDFSLLDLHVKSTTGRYAAGEWVVDDVLSEAIDKGDPAATYANEPMPNGNCVNMGFYGNTAEASKSMEVETAAIKSCEIDQTKDYTNPYMTVTLADKGDWELPVRFYWGLSQGGDAGDGWEHSVVLSEAAHAGDVLSSEFGVYLEHGATVYYRVILGNGAGVDAKADSFVITSELPEDWGKGGGPNVIHVFAGRSGRGTCWLDAVGTLEDALKAVTAERNTIWVSGELVRAAPAAKMGVTVPVTIIGGFRDLDETEPETGSAVVDGATLYDGLILENSAAVTIRKVDFVRALGHGLAKTGAGDLTLEKCRFLDNGYGTEVDGRGLLCSGSSGTTVTMTDCVVSGNVARAASEVYGGNGAGASFTTFKSVVLNRVDFLDNGFARSFLTARAVNYDGNTPGREASRGSALRVNGAPLAATGCRFVGNRCTGHNSGGSTVAVEGSSGGTTFANCLFSANATYWWSYGNFATRGGALYVNLGNKADAVSLVNCTFAHNLLFAGECGASLTVDKGAVAVKNSIFWGNRFGAASKGNNSNAGNFVSAHEIYVKADGSVAFDHSLIPSVDAPSVRVAAGGVWTPTNVLNDDPLFVTTTNEVLATQARRASDAWRYADYYLPATDLEAFNVHLRSRTGYTDEKTGQLVKHGGVRSPAIDAGDPATPVGEEPVPNGRRINLGYYGGTPYASRTDSGLMLIFD